MRAKGCWAVAVLRLLKLRHGDVEMMAGRDEVTKTRCRHGDDGASVVGFGAMVSGIRSRECS